MDSDFISFVLLRDLNVRVVVIGSVLLGVGSAAIGCFALLRKRALAGDAIAHSALPGVALAFLAFGTKETAVLLLGASVTGWLSMIIMDRVVRWSKLSEDASIGIVLSVLFGLGILLLTHIQASGDANQSGLDKFLFGQAASLLPSDIVVFGAVSALLVLSILLLYKEFTLLAFDPDFALAVGLPVRTLEFILTTLIVFAVVVGLQAVGVVLMAAMLITPGAAARYWTERLWLMIALAAVFGAVAGIAGAYVSYASAGMPTGPWIVTFATAIFTLSILLGPRRGIVARIRRHALNKHRTQRENVLKAMHRLGELDGNPHGSRSTSDILVVRRMHSPALRRVIRSLRRAGYIEVVPPDRWRLTVEGEREGRRITRLHRLWEVYLTEYVQIAPDHVHDDAESIEHVLTPDLEEELQQLLDRPTTDPHRQTIPYGN